MFERIVSEVVPPRELDQPEGKGTVDSAQGTALYERKVHNKGRGTLVGNIQGVR